MKLENKGGLWQFNDTVWTMPVEGAEGNIENESLKKVLGIQSTTVMSGTAVKMQLRNKTIASGQKWLIGKKDGNGWFSIIHTKSKLILTTQRLQDTNVITTVAGKYKRLENDLMLTLYRES